MIRSNKRFRVPKWHKAFLAMMPTIKTHAKVAFRHLDAEAREEAIQEVICNACCVYARLVELNKTDLAYPSVLARFGVAQVKDGRKVGGHLNIRDVSSSYCQQHKGISVERLDQYDKTENAWLEILVEDKHAGPADTATVRIDFNEWLKSLTNRLRKIATLLAMGEKTGIVAKKFRVSPGRISQIRNLLADTWKRFHGEADLDGFAKGVSPNPAA
jgi:hypothetical protein